MFTTAEIIERLKVLWRKLEDEGSYVSGNTIQLAVVRLEELTADQYRVYTQVGTNPPVRYTRDEKK